MYKTNPTPTMTSKSRHRRTRVIQRRYRRKGRRKRFRIPPDKNSHWKTRVRIQRTYNFNTLPHHDATPLEYTTYIHEKLLHRYYKLRHLSLRNRAYLRQQRYLYYKPFGCRHIKSLHIKPPNSSPQRNPTQEALKLEAINLTTSVLLHTDSYPFVTLTKLPSDPTIQPQPCQYTPLFNNPLHTQPRFPSNPFSSYSLNGPPFSNLTFPDKIIAQRNIPRHSSTFYLSYSPRVFLQSASLTCLLRNSIPLLHLLAMTSFSFLNQKRYLQRNSILPFLRSCRIQIIISLISTHKFKYYHRSFSLHSYHCLRHLP